MRDVKYRKMLEDKLEIHMAIHEYDVFMPNGAFRHHSKLMSDFFGKQNIKTLDRPDNRPDLNPFENLWAILKRKVADEHHTSGKDLEIAIKRIWTQKLTAEYCKRLVHGGSCRLQAVIKNRYKILDPHTKLANVTYF